MTDEQLKALLKFFHGWLDRELELLNAGLPDGLEQNQVWRHKETGKRAQFFSWVSDSVRQKDYELVPEGDFVVLNGLSWLLSTLGDIVEDL